MTRVLGVLAALAAATPAEEPTRLGGLVRWFVEEENQGRRDELLETIRRVAGGNVETVAGSIRRGEHFLRPARPELRRGGPPPVFGPDRTRIQPVAACAGDFARLLLPAGYDAARAHALLLDLGDGNLPPADGAVVLKIEPAAHPEAAKHAMAAEALILSLLAHAMDVVHVDPDRVFLRGQGSMAYLAWYVAFHNPDRFAGVVALQGFWKGVEPLSGHGNLVHVLAVERRRGDPLLRQWMASLDATGPGHLLLRAPGDPAQDGALLPQIARWQSQTVRVREPKALDLRCNRNASLRAHWIRVTPRVRSLQEQEELARTWKHRAMARPAEVTARIDPEDGNLLHVTTNRVTAFDVFAAPGTFDPTRPLRVYVNGAPGGAKLVDFDIGDLLDDYRERRDPGLLYACRLTFAAP